MKYRIPKFSRFIAENYIKDNKSDDLNKLVTLDSMIKNINHIWNLGKVKGRKYEKLEIPTQK